MTSYCPKRKTIDNQVEVDADVITVNGDILPAIDDVSNLGSSTKRFKTINVVTMVNPTILNASSQQIDWPAETTGGPYTLATLTGNETLTSKSLTSPKITSAQLDTGTFFEDTTDSTKNIYFDVSGATALTRTTLVCNQTNNNRVTFPNATDSLATLSQVETLSNKTLDAANLTGTTTIASITGCTSVDTASISSYIVNGNLQLSGNGTGFVSIGATGMNLQNATASYSPTVLDYFEEDVTGSFTNFNWGGSYSGAVPYRIQRIGNKVFVYITPILMDVSSADSTIVSTGSIPTRFLPPATMSDVSIVNVSGSFNYYLSGVWAQGIWSLAQATGIVTLSTAAKAAFSGTSFSYDCITMDWFVV